MKFGKEIMLIITMIFGIMLSLNVKSCCLEENEALRNAKYISTEEELISFLDQTDGIALVCGEIKAENPVTLESLNELIGEETYFMLIEETLERYETQKERKKIRGKYRTVEETDWFIKSSEEYKTDKISLLGQTFNFDKIYTPSRYILAENYLSPTEKYIYEVKDLSYKGTTYIKLKAGEIDEIEFFDKTYQYEVQEQKYLPTKFFTWSVFIIYTAFFSSIYIGSKKLEKDKIKYEEQQNMDF